MGRPWLAGGPGGPRPWGRGPPGTGALGAPVGPGPVGPTRPLRVRRSPDDVAAPVAAAQRLPAALRSNEFGLGRGEGMGACASGAMRRMVKAYWLMLWNDILELEGYGSYGKR